MVRIKDTAWHEEFLRLVQAGMDFKHAIQQIGTTQRTLYTHFEEDPAFRAAADEAKIAAETAPGWTGRADTSWHAPLLALLAVGLTRPQAAYVVGVNIGTVASHRHRLPAFAAAVSAAISAADRAQSGHAWPVDEDNLLRLLRHLAAGKDLATACLHAAVPLPTVKRWRRRYPDVDAAIAAALEHQRRHDHKETKDA